MRFPAANDTRLLVAGVGAVLALVAYLGVAFANTHASVLATAAPGLPNKVAPWTPSNSNLLPSRRKTRGTYVVRVTPLKRGSYGALVPTLLPNPTPGHRFVVSLSLRGARPGRIGVSIDEFRPGADSVYVVEKMVPATAKWRRFTFRGRVKGTWLGLGMYVFRADLRRRSWFAMHGLTVRLSQGNA